MAGSRRSRAAGPIPRPAAIPAAAATARRRRQDRRRPVSRRSRCRRPQALRPRRPPPAARARAQPAAGAIRQQPANPPPPQPADAAPQSDDTVVTETPTQKIDERPGGIFRPRQDHRPHHFVRRGDRRNGAIRRAAGHGAGLLHAAADRGDQHRCLCRSRRSDAAGRDQAHLHRLDVRLEPRPACRRASDLRRLADRLRRQPVQAPAPVAQTHAGQLRAAPGACAATPASAATRRVAVAAVAPAPPR